MRKKIVYPKIPIAQTIVSFCKEKGIENIVISPGSRNAPLIKGFVMDSFFKTYSIVDERSAGFFALGIAQQIKKPVALLCTSGSALLNYYPAVSEAFYSDIPLVVLSADRMPYAIDMGNGQTINQKKVYEPHIENAAYLLPDVIHSTNSIMNSLNQQLIEKGSSELAIIERQKEIQLSNEVLIDRALNTAIDKQGPVHLNIPMEEPLYELTEEKVVISQVTALEKKVKKINYQLYADSWNKSKRKMILVGTLPPNSLSEKIIEEWASDSSLVVLTEKTSNINHPNFINSIDVLIASIEDEGDEFVEQFNPELLLTFGGMVVSKKIKNFLIKFPPTQHWHIDVKKAYDTYYSLNEHVKLSVSSFFEEIFPLLNSVESEYNTFVFDYYRKRKERAKFYLETIPFSDLKAFEIITKALPKNSHLQLSNSSTIRYVQLFDLPEKSAVFCNRGTSGIDGSLSTAVGASIYIDTPTIFITGDLSFFYDINGLWNKYVKNDFRVILINNQGGGIFRILPGEKDEEIYSEFFETVHHREAKYVCQDFDIEYSKATDEESLKKEMKEIITPSNRPKLLEILTPRLVNDKVLINYFEEIK